MKPTPLQTVIDIQGNEKISTSPGYRQWAAVFNLKQSAATLNLIQEYGGMEAFDELHTQAVREKLKLSQEINGLEAEIKNLDTIRDHLRAYGRTKDVFKEYQNQKSQRKKEQYYNAHRVDIAIHEAAKRDLAQAVKPVPSVKAITAEMERLRIAEANVIPHYKQKQATLKEMETIRKNLYAITRQGNKRKLNRNNDLSI